MAARVLRTLVGVGFLLTVATCRDGMEPQVHLAPIAVAPVLPSDAALASFGLAIDRVRFIVVRPSATPDTLADITVALPPDSATIDLDIRVPLIAASEVMEVSIVVLAGTIPLFEGTAPVEVTRGVPPATPTEIPLQTYVGPGAGVDSIAIIPAAPFLFLNDSLRFQVEAFQGGVPVSQFYVAWNTSDPLLPVNSVGTLRAPATRGGVRVRARTPSGAADSVDATFVPLPTQLVITGGIPQTGVVGQTLQVPLEVEVRGSDNLPVGGVTVRFQAPPGGAPADVTVPSDATGRARVIAVLGPTAGIQNFQASLPAFSAVPSVTFGLPALAGPISATTSLLTVGSGTVASGSDVLLTLRAKDASGNALATGGAGVVFSASGGTSTGSIGPTTDNGDGTYTATFTGVLAGTATTIGATIDSQTVTSTRPTIAVVPGPVATVLVSPAAIVLNALNATQQFSAAAFDAAGNAVTTTFTWSSTNTTIARVDQAGIATSLANGSAQIVATSGAVADTVDLTVQQVVASVVVSHTNVLLDMGQDVQLTAKALDAGASVVPGVTFTWASGNIAIATVDPNGLVSGGVEGTTDITATTSTAPLVSGSAQVTVTLFATATRLVFIQQPPSSVFFGEPFTVQVAAQDGSGRTVTGAAGSVTLSENVASVSTLQGTLIQPLVNGVATFTDLVVTGTGSMAIDARTGSLAGTSNPFQVVDQTVIPDAGASPYFAGVNSITGRVYVSNASGRSVTFLDGSAPKVAGTIGVGENPRWEAVNADAKQVYISDFVEGAVYIIDEGAEKALSPIPVGTNATQPAVNSAGNMIYVPAQQTEVLSLVIVDLLGGKVTGAVPIGGTGDNAGGAVWDPRTGLVWVVVETQGLVVSVDPVGLKVVDQITVGEGPYGIALDSLRNRLYVSLSLQNQVAVVDLTLKRTEQPVTVGQQPQGLSVDVETGRVFVANFGDGLKPGTVTVIDGVEVVPIRTFTVGVGPGDAEYNLQNRLVYVPNRGDNSISIVKP